jgi:hypothetical protein
MATRRRSGSNPQSRELYQLLLFPQRAEFLEQHRFDAYRVHLEHWRELSLEFRRAFEAVYVRQSASILLVHGQQGTGKTLFARKLEEDFAKTEDGTISDVQENLWAVLAGGNPVIRATAERAATTTALRRVAPSSGWLAEQRAFARQDKHTMRVFVVDDVHRDGFLREWAELSQGEYMRLKADGHYATVLESVAQRLVEDCRGDFQRSLFVLLSNNTALLETLHQELERWHVGLSRVLELPLPEPALKEKIVRTNTNRLNRRSYWYCLDRGGPSEKQQAYQTLQSEGGFLDVFNAIDRALGSGSSSRPGRPANKNLLTLVTLGTDPLTVQSYISDLELGPDDEDLGEHVAAWLFRQQWASALSTDDDAYARRAELFESEFTLRWVTLGMKALWWLIHAPPADPVCDRLVEFMRMSPRIGDSQPHKDRAAQAFGQLDAEVGALLEDHTFAGFDQRFREAGRSRSTNYEAALAQRFGQQLSRGLVVLPSLRPDVILELVM